MVNNAARTPRVQLAGVAIGNGFVDPLRMTAGYADIIYNAGIISGEDYVVAQGYVRDATRAIESGDYVGAYHVWDAFLNGDTTEGGAWFTNVTGLTNYFNVAIDTPANFSYFVGWVTSPAVRAATGVGAHPYVDGNVAVEVALVGDVMFSQLPRVEGLLQAGLKVAIYNGALDLICGAPLTERYLPTLDWPGADAWRAQRRAIWHDAAGNVAGYARSALNLVQVVMRGAGHMAPYDRPEDSLDLISRFVEGRAFN